MVECRNCGEVYFGDADRLGARCRRCREPLYERREQARRPDEARPAGQCASHAHNPAVGVCGRCGTYICALCRTRWEDRPLCPACVVRALDAREVRPEDAKAHRRQALLAVVFGLSAWALVLLCFLIPLLVRPSSTTAQALILTAGLLGITSFVPSLFGVGQAAAAIRARGSRMVMATFGLVLSASHVGAALGFAMLVLWHR
jgi:hypothetical protein